MDRLQHSSLAVPIVGLPVSCIRLDIDCDRDVTARVTGPDNNFPPSISLHGRHRHHHTLRHSTDTASAVDRLSRMQDGTVSRPQASTDATGVHKLPYELLSEIFAMRVSTLDIPTCETQPSCLKDLTDVCSLWREIVLSLNLPFKDIDIHLVNIYKQTEAIKRNLASTKDGLEAYLARSKDDSISLTVHIVDGYLSPSHQSKTDMGVWFIAMSHQARYSSITVRASYVGNLGLILPLDGPFRRLQKITFNIEEDSRSVFPKIFVGFDDMITVMPDIHYQISDTSMLRRILGFPTHVDPEKTALAEDYCVIQSILDCPLVKTVWFRFQFDTPHYNNFRQPPHMPQFMSQYPDRVIVTELWLQQGWLDDAPCRLVQLPITVLTLEYFQSSTVETLPLLLKGCPMLQELRISGGSAAQTALEVLVADTSIQFLPHLEKLEIKASGFSTPCEPAALADLLDRRPDLYVTFDISSFILSDMGENGARMLRSRHPRRFCQLLS